MEKLLRQLGTKDNLVMYIDGHPAEEKRTPMAVAAYYNVNAAFHWTFEDRSDFVDYLQRNGYNAILCDTGADPRIAADSQPVDVIVSRDSDFIGYSSVRKIWRPVGRATENKCLIYCKDDILSSFKLTDIQLTALACVVRNDYDKNVPSCAVTTSYKIINDLGSRQDVETLVKSYLNHAKIVKSNVNGETFARSIKVFVHHHQSRASVEAVDEDDATVDDWTPRHQRHQQYNRYRTIDQPPPRLQGGTTDTTEPSKQHCHRPRYAVKERGPSKEQDSPDIIKEYKLKPYTVEQERRWQNSQKVKHKKDEDNNNSNETSNKNKKKSRKVVPSINSMTKVQLIGSMKWQHPLVSLKIGTVSANSKLALGSESDEQVQARAWIDDITRQALTTKRDTQEFLGQFIEAMFKTELTSEDRRFSMKCVPKSPLPSREEQEHGDDDDGDDDNDNKTDPKAPFKRFYSILSAHIYSRKRLPSTASGRQVQSLITRAAELQVVLPVQRQWITVYSTSDLLQSASYQLFIEIKKLYVTGSKDLEKKLNDIHDHKTPTGPTWIDSTLPSIENFMVLNSLTKNSRRIAPLSPINRRFISFGERQLITLFW
ncbi:hypothetical protein BGZ92_011316 [Podila epicladia]|nr:hypothetical protein BGZ92_011316 [Podila epicladia]